MGEGRFLFCSSIALYKPLLRVAEIITSTHGLKGHVIAPQDFPPASSSRTFWRCESKDVDSTFTSLKVHFLPARKGNVERFGFDQPSLNQLLGELNPDYIWIHEEFWQGIPQQILWHYRFKARPQIIAYAAINHAGRATPLFSPKWPFFSLTRLKQIALWPRLNGVAACATKSMECARRIGLPGSVPISVNFLPVLGPEEATDSGIHLPWSTDDSFTIGFAGILSEQKGWKVLLKAMTRLPEKFKVLLVGEGEQREELEAWLRKSDLSGRAYFAGFLPKDRLLATYPLFDVFVLPSITLPDLAEQFGAVLAEAMACGVPVIGSDSGAIPETVGEAGVIVPENDPQALADAIRRICEDHDFHRQAVALGQERCRIHYTCESYAHSIAKALEIGERNNFSLI